MSTFNRSLHELGTGGQVYRESLRPVLAGKLRVGRLLGFRGEVNPKQYFDVEPSQWERYDAVVRRIGPKEYDVLTSEYEPEEGRYLLGRVTLQSETVDPRTFEGDFDRFRDLYDEDSPDLSMGVVLTGSLQGELRSDNEQVSSRQLVAGVFIAKTITQTIERVFPR